MALSFPTGYLLGNGSDAFNLNNDLKWPKAPRFGRYEDVAGRKETLGSITISGFSKRGFNIHYNDHNKTKSALNAAGSTGQCCVFWKYNDKWHGGFLDHMRCSAEENLRPSRQFSNGDWKKAGPALSKAIKIKNKNLNEVVVVIVSNTSNDRTNFAKVYP